jgi:DNA-binding NtrC family response regulator
MNPKPSVLIYGFDHTLLETRSWVFERNGFEVDTATHIAQAEQALKARLIDLFLICHTIPPQERRKAVAAIHTIRPQAKVMVVTTASHPEPEGPWKTVDALAGTEAMIVAARRALEAL